MTTNPLKFLSLLSLAITAALAGRDHDFPDDASPDPATLFILTAFTVLDVGPFAVSCHRESFDI